MQLIWVKEDHAALTEQEVRDYHIPDTPRDLMQTIEQLSDPSCILPLGSVDRYLKQIETDYSRISEDRRLAWRSHPDARTKVWNWMDLVDSVKASDLLERIQQGQTHVIDASDFEQDRSLCEYAYIIDFAKRSIGVRGIGKGVVLFDFKDLSKGCLERYHSAYWKEKEEIDRVDRLARLMEDMKMLHGRHDESETGSDTGTEGTVKGKEKAEEV